jgi:hypothetical protein
MITRPGTPRRHRDSRRRGTVLSRQRLPRTPATYPCVDGREGLVSIIGAADVGSKRGRPRRGSDYAGLLSRVREAGLLRPRLAYYTMRTVLKARPRPHRDALHPKPNDGYGLVVYH